MAPLVDAGEDEDDGGFQVVGRKGRALPRRARRAASAALPESLSKLDAATARQWTDVHFRSFARLLTRRTLLFTEMIPAAAVVDAEKEGSLTQLLAFHASHRPMAVQLGGNSPSIMARAARLCADAGFDEVNLNVGCPSSKVTTGGYGACLMKKPELVHDIAGAVLQACSGREGTAVTVKHRLGVDDCDSWQELLAFVRAVAGAGITHFIVHARKALLGVLSCEGNRTIPPLKYDWVRALAQSFPELTFELNGGVQSLSEARQLLDEGFCEGVMVGRAAYNSPWPLLAGADAAIFGSENPGHSRQEVLNMYLDYAAAFFNSQQRAGQVHTSTAALELEQELAAPVSHLFEDLTPLFREVLQRELAAREVETVAPQSRRHCSSASMPPFLLRRAAAAALAAVTEALGKEACLSETAYTTSELPAS
eukprot:TRINITY_DN11738_c0_g1_i3.p1 TRINITY_DN11738_c0_g1~~TRINITY_DN11738_c0_g1_i3.p1  ORF type:complete len:424 (-),score=96.17 TRINITY_DN11738_c0_g1_i3:9-1280(-)